MFTLTNNTKSLIDWCLTPTLTIFQLYHGMNKCNINLDIYKIIIYKSYLSIKQAWYMYKSNILVYKTYLSIKQACYMYKSNILVYKTSGYMYK